MQWLKKLLRPPDPVTIDDTVWDGVVRRFGFLATLEPDESAQLRELTGRFIAVKAFSGAAGLILNDDIVAAIAAQACLPILHLGLERLDAFEEIIVYPTEFHVQRQIVDEDGVVHDVSGPLSGEAMPGGPVVLSWEDVEAGDAGDGYNVVIHEFVHKLDMATGAADGVPPFDPRLHRGLDRDRWIETLDAAYADFCDRLDAIDARIPANIDPESPQGHRYYAKLPFDAYAAEHPSEFFAVASEAFFVTPGRLRGAYPELYTMLDSYFRPRRA